MQNHNPQYNELKGGARTSDCQAGCRTNRGTTDMTFVLLDIIEKVNNTDFNTCITCIDYIKAQMFLYVCFYFRLSPRLNIDHKIIKIGTNDRYHV